MASLAMGALLGVAQLLAIGAIGFVLVLIAHTMWGLTHPKRRTDAWAISRGLPCDPSELDEPLAFESFAFRTQNAEIGAWNVRGLDPTGPTLVMVHGWGSSRLGALKRIEALAPFAARFVVCDLPGHGYSGGSTRLGSSEHEVVRELVRASAVGAPVTLYGWSMGAGVALRTASEFGEELGIERVIAEAPYIDAPTPARNVIRLQGLPVALNLRPAMMLLGLRFGVGPSWRGFARDEIASRVKVPVLVLHGSDDPVCPVEHGERIAACAPSARFVRIERGGHNNLWTDPELRSEMIERIRAELRGEPA